MRAPEKVGVKGLKGKEEVRVLRHLLLGFKHSEELYEGFERRFLNLNPPLLDSARTLASREHIFEFSLCLPSPNANA